MKGALFVIGFCLTLLVLQNFFLASKIDSIKQEITDLRQELSYD